LHSVGIWILVEPKPTLGVTVAEAQLVATGWRASKMFHADVYNDKNENRQCR
jgi:hypothetical protein